MLLPIDRFTHNSLDRISFCCSSSAFYHQNPRSRIQFTVCPVELTPLSHSPRAFYRSNATRHPVYILRSAPETSGIVARPRQKRIWGQTPIFCCRRSSDSTFYLRRSSALKAAALRVVAVCKGLLVCCVRDGREVELQQQHRRRQQQRQLSRGRRWRTGERKSAWNFVRVIMREREIDYERETKWELYWIIVWNVLLAYIKTNKEIICR